jgi:hypothetical protein
LVSLYTFNLESNLYVGKSKLEWTLRPSASKATSSAVAFRSCFCFSMSFLFFFASWKCSRNSLSMATNYLCLAAFSGFTFKFCFLLFFRVFMNSTKSDSPSLLTRSHFANKAFLKALITYLDSACASCLFKPI